MLTDDRRLMGPFPGPPKICYNRGKNLREEICREKQPAGVVRRGQEPDLIGAWGAQVIRGESPP